MTVTVCDVCGDPWGITCRCDACELDLCDDCGALHQCGEAPACHRTRELHELDNVRKPKGSAFVFGDCPDCHSTVSRRVTPSGAIT